VGLEIERKFLVQDESWRGLGEKVFLSQGYLSSDPDRIVRVRLQGEQAFLTIKGRAQGISRSEWEYAIPVEEAQAMLASLCTVRIEKWRHKIMIDGLLWEVDEFLGANAGLVVAEVELLSEMQEFIKPTWLGQEVSNDHRYANSSLFKQPFSTWPETV
jgi:adenylate cyclase